MFGRRKYVGRRRLADQDMHFEQRSWVDDDDIAEADAVTAKWPESGFVSPNLIAMQAKINEDIARLAQITRTPATFIRRDGPTSAEALAELLARPKLPIIPKVDWDRLFPVDSPQYGLFQAATPVKWGNPRPISWRETISSWQEAYRSFARRVVTGLGQDPFEISIEPDPGTAEWWEWHHGSVIFDEHLGMLELPPGKGLAGKGAT